MNNPAVNLNTVTPATDLAVVIAKRILADVMNYRRVPNHNEACGDADCQVCSSHHLPKIVSAVRKNKPVKFVLPAFPGKSPNTEKVLGPLPDLAEQLSLEFLGKLGQQIKKILRSWHQDHRLL
jgi:pyoverdine/dityrosine biosynthesis protein Dit1